MDSFLVLLGLMSLTLVGGQHAFRESVELLLNGNDATTYDGLVKLPKGGTRSFAGPVHISAEIGKETMNVLVCLKLFTKPSGIINQWFDGECTFFINGFVNGTATVPASTASPGGWRGHTALDPRAGSYYVSVAPALVPGIVEDVHVKLTFHGFECPRDEFGLTSLGCNLDVEKVFDNTTIRGEIPPPHKDGTISVKYYRLAGVDDLFGPKTSFVSVVATPEDTKTPGRLHVYARWGALPTADQYDGDSLVLGTGSEATVHISEPQRNTDWFLGVLAVNTSTSFPFSLKWEVTLCSKDEIGDPCEDIKRLGDKPGDQITVAINSASLTVLKLPTGQLELNVASASLLAKNPRPLFFARWGQPPSRDTFDYKDCTEGGRACESVRLIRARAPANASKLDSWYLGLIVGHPEIADIAGGAVTQYDVVTWSISEQNECPANCNGHGTCDHETLSCHCNSSWGELDCSVNKGLSMFDLALVIGGSILVAVGVIGCLVYFVQKRNRRAGFDRV